jgi:hypothetical protein
VGAFIDRVGAPGASRNDEDDIYLRLYSEREWALQSSLSIKQKLGQSYKKRKRARLSLNVVKSNVDAWVALVCQSRPHINFLTKGADWGLQKKARLRTRFVEALFHAEKFYDLDSRIHKACGIFGLGGLHVLKEHGRVRYELVQPTEIKVDPEEAMAGDVRTLVRERISGIDKGVAMAMWPDHREAIARTPVIGHSNRIPFADAWHLPSGPDTDDGVHVQCIPGVATLSRKPYRWNEFPVVTTVFDDAPIGSYGAGIAEALIGIQYEINVILRTIQSNIWSGGNLKVAVPRGANISDVDINNKLGGTFVHYTGPTPPTFFAHDICSPQLFQQLQYLETKSYDVTGVSQQNAQSQTPFASQSGRARIVADMAYSKRFIVSQRRHEDFAAAVAQRSLEAAADLADEGKDIEVIFPGRDHLEVVKYSDVASESADDFDCQAWSASLAGETPAARLAQIEQMMQMGMLDLAGAMLLFEIPHDLRAHMEQVLAPIELAREAIDRIIEDGVAVTPNPLMDLALAAKTAQLWYQRGELRGVDPSRLYLLLEFHNLCQRLLGQQQPPANPGQATGAPAELSGQALTPGPTQVPPAMVA